MTDALYVLGILLFFATMRLYVAGCARLGRGEPAREVSDASR